MKRQGFTLIELLVVITIIAILAAILFPVLSSARESARQATCASRFYQVARAVAAYSADYDTFMPLTEYAASFAFTDLSNNRFMQQLLQPYMKDWTLFRCPSDPNARDEILANCFGGPPRNQLEREQCYSLTANTGYNYAYLSPVVCYGGSANCGNVGRGWRNSPTHEARIRMPASTILFVDSIWFRDPQTGAPEGGGNWIVMPPCRFWRDPNTGRPVDTFTMLYTPERAWSWYSYGTACGCSDWAGAGWMLQAARGWCLWMEFGGTWPWHRRERMTVAFVDGHTKAYTPRQLTVGCDARPCMNGFIRDPEAYLWDMDDYY